MDDPNFAAEIRDLADRGEIDEAIRRGRERIAELKTNSDSWSEISQLVESVAFALSLNGDYCAAALDYEQAVQLHRSHSLIPTDHLPRVLMYWGRMLLWTGRPAEAEEKFAEALTLLDHLPIESQGGRAFVLVDLAALHRREKEYSMAEVILKEALYLMAHFGYLNQHLAFSYFDLAFVYRAQGRMAAADRTMAKSIEWLRKANGDPHGFAVALSINGERLKEGGRIAEARACQEEALGILQKIRKPGHNLLERVKVRLARLDALPTE